MTLFTYALITVGSAIQLTLSLPYIQHDPINLLLITVSSAIQLTLSLLYIEYDTINLRFNNSRSLNPTHLTPTL